MTYSKKMQTEENESRSPVLPLAIGLAVALSITFAALAVFSAVLFFASVSEKLISPAATVFTLVGLLIGAFVAARRIQSRGFVWGALLGGVYYLLLYICALAMYSDFNFSVRTLLFLLLGMGVGAIGGRLGAGTASEKTPRSHRKRKKTR